MTKHTPGPWRYDYADGYCGEIIASNGKSVCSFTDEPNESDAHLIAGAVDLLESLIQTHGLLEATLLVINDSEARAIIKQQLDANRAAVAKAEGRA